MKGKHRAGEARFQITKNTLLELSLKEGIGEDADLLSYFFPRSGLDNSLKCALTQLQSPLQTLSWNDTSS